MDRELGKTAAEHPATCTLREIGRSREGRPMTMLTMPGGPSHVLVIGAPHPNEPIGLAVIPALARYLAEHPRRGRRSPGTSRVRRPRRRRGQPGLVGDDLAADAGGLPPRPVPARGRRSARVDLPAPPSARPCRRPVPS
ncbi:M14 family zinc carboxypeptidase [Streptomyces sp. C8S0]|uniref:M14 family zinc carboxypeptidase n=1 Tax=Streptomyces sp. C8S0 TaxID=2585716 RepID=UPI001D05312A|nr:M14 family zinc carboxypeptidase [Streptomyces sp. C8S0]